LSEKLDYFADDLDYDLRLNTTREDFIYYLDLDVKDKYAGGGEVQDELYDLVSDFDSNEYEAFCYEFDIDIDDANQMTDFISQLSDEDAKNIINQIENGYFSDSEDEYAGGGKIKLYDVVAYNKATDYDNKINGKIIADSYTRKVDAIKTMQKFQNSYPFIEIKEYMGNDPYKYAGGGEAGKSMRDNYDALIGRVGIEYYFLDEIFKYKDGFKGATGTIVMPVSKQYYDYATSEEGILERYMDAMGEDEWLNTLGLDRDDFEDEDEMIKAIEDGIYDLYRVGELNPFEEVNYKLEEQMRELPEFSDSDEYPLFEIIGGGRIFDKNIKFDKIYNQELFNKIKEIEEFAEGGQAGKKGKLNATYIPKRNIKTLITTYGNTIKGKDLLDGAYTTRKDIRQDPKMVRTIFEEEEFAEFNNGGEAKKHRRRANTQTGRTDRSVDKTRVGKPVGYRFTNSLASKLRKDQYAVPTEKQITKYLGKGIYKENRKNRSDRDKIAKL
jgi:hypothetical protein